MHVFLQSTPQLPTGSAPRRVRGGRAVEATAPDTRAFFARAPAGVPTPVIPLALPNVFRAAPRSRMGPVPKLAPGRQGSGLGMPVALGFATNVGGVWTPLESVPATQPNFLVHRPMPPSGKAGYLPGRALGPTYAAMHGAFRPATLFYAHGRSVGAWAQSSYSRQYRPLTPTLQPRLLQGRVIPKLGIGSAQRSAGLYTFGYPTRHSVAAQIGGGPVGVLGGNSA